MSVDLAEKNGNQKLEISLRKLRNAAVPQGVKSEQREEYFNTTPLPPARIVTYVDGQLDRFNYSVFEDRSETTFEVLESASSSERTSVPTIDVKKDEYFEEIYDIEPDMNAKTGHALNVLDVLEEEKIVIFDPIFREMKRKNINTERLENYLVDDIEKGGVIEVPKNLMEKWWDDAYDSRWFAILEPENADQKTLNYYSEEERKKYQRRKYDGSI